MATVGQIVAFVRGEGCTTASKVAERFGSDMPTTYRILHLAASRNLVKAKPAWVGRAALYWCDPEREGHPRSIQADVKGRKAKKARRRSQPTPRQPRKRAYVDPSHLDKSHTTLWKYIKRWPGGISTGLLREAVPHVRPDRLRRKLRRLEDAGLIEGQPVLTGRIGRPEVVWKALR